MKVPKYLLRLILLILLVGTFPVLVLGWYSYNYSLRTVLEKVNEGNAQILRQTQLRTEQTLKEIDYSASQLLNSLSVDDVFAKPLTFKDVDIIDELYNDLAGIQTFELGTKDVYLYSMQQDWLISNSGFNEYSQPEMKELLREYAVMAQGSTWISEDLSKRIHESDSISFKHSILNIKKWPINAVNPRGMLAVILSGQNLYNLLDLDPELMGQLVIMDSTGHVVLDRDSSMLGKDLSHEAYIQPILQSGEQTGLFKSSDRNLSVSYRKSSYNGWVYVYVLPIGELTKQARGIAWTSLGVSLAVLLITVMAALMGARRMYRPIRSIYRSMSMGNTQFSKDEFGVIAEGIQRLLADQTKLQFQLDGQQSYLTELLERKLLTGEVNASEIQEQLRYYGFTMHWEQMRVLLIRIDTLEDTRFSANDRDLLLFAIGNIASEIAAAEERLPPILFQDALVMIIGTQLVSPDPFKERAYQLAVTVQEALKSYLKIQASVGISRCFTEWTDAQKGYSECASALKYRIGLGKEAVLFIEDVQPERSKISSYPKESAAELIDAIQSLDSERAQKALATFIAGLSNTARDHHDYQLSLIRLLTDLICLLQDSGVSIYALQRSEKSLFDEMLQIHTAREIESWFCEQVVLPGIALLERFRDKQFRSISEEVKRMIAEAFDTDLTLEKCASRINYHPQYISRVFRQETGINFADYLAQYRLCVAKKWLKETNMKISDIAERLKYNNPANFIRYFRKMEGMTPGQYRDKL